MILSLDNGQTAASGGQPGRFSTRLDKRCDRYFGEILDLYFASSASCSRTIFSCSAFALA